MTMQPREVQFPTVDEPLRNDVSRLGALVGEIIRDQAGDALYERVEAIRTAAIARRSSDMGSLADLSHAAESISLEDLADLVRGFSTYFQVVNLAERVHRIRRNRDREREAPGSLEHSLRHTIAKVAKSGVDFQTMVDYLSDLTLEPVFTAHPSEATRRTLLEKEQAVVRRLLRMLDPTIPESEVDGLFEQIRSIVTSGWQTRLHPEARPRVQDEMEHVLFYLTDVLYRVVPTYYDSLRHALSEQYGGAAQDLRMPVILRFGSWVGGDMDGNPNVTAETIAEALNEHRSLIVSHYVDDVRVLARELSQSLSEVAVSDSVTHRFERYARMMPEQASQIRPRHKDMPYRCLLTLMAARLEGTQAGSEYGYSNGAEFANDLQLIRASLEAHHGRHAGLQSVRRMQQRARTFGFHLATLDVRQDAIEHRRAVGLMLGEGKWLEKSAEERTRTLENILEDDLPLEYAENALVEKTLDVFRQMGEGRRQFGSNACGVFIVSMTQDADDLLSVLLLAREAGLSKGKDGIPIHVTPLFETVDDLKAAPRILETLLASPYYQRHLERRNQRQVAMIGYSDSNKDGGIAAARWAIRTGQEEMITVASKHDVRLSFFHGRGGTVSRGGGNTRRGILGGPANSINGYLRVTEQGEVINQKYALREIALRNLEQTTSAMLEADFLKPQSEFHPQQSEIMAAIASRSREHYRALVVDDPAFFQYFRTATPIDAIERMAIGSRPAKRRAGKGVSDLRAIPWVFAWAQTRTGFPGSFGLGTALEWAAGEYGEDALRQMLGWPFFLGLVNDVEMVLAKSDLNISEAYAQLAPDSSGHVFGAIRAELEKTANWILKLKGSDALLADQPVLRRAIGLRNPYVDPINVTQIRLLRQWRESGSEENELLDALLITINGISQGIQNTG